MDNLLCPNCQHHNTLPSDAVADARIAPTGEIKDLYTFPCTECAAVLEYFADGTLLDYAPR